MLHQVHAVLKPGGHLLITDGPYDFLAGRHNVAVGSARRLTKTRLGNHPERSGFGIVWMSYWGMLLFAVLFAQRVVVERLFGLFRNPAPERESFQVPTVPVLNQVLFASVRAEVPLLRGIGLPLGASVCVLGHKA